MCQYRLPRSVNKNISRRYLSFYRFIIIINDQQAAKEIQYLTNATARREASEAS